MFDPIYQSAIAEILLKVSLIFLLAFVVSPLLRRPTHRAKMWLFAFLMTPLAVILTGSDLTPLRIVLPDRGEELIGEVPTEASAPWTDPVLPIFEPSLEKATESKVSPLPEVSHGKSLGFWLVLIWLSGAALCLLPFIISMLRLHLLETHRAHGSPWALWKLMHQGCRQRPHLLFSRINMGVFACGIFQPRVILPESSLSWPHNQLQSTLLHETAHLDRRDTLTRLLSTMVTAMLWFHPLVWLAQRRLIIEQELACDDFVIGQGVERAEYAEVLLTGTSLSPALLAGAIPFARRSRSQLGTRILQILKPKARNPMKKSTLLTLSLAAIAATVSICTLGFSQSTSKPSSTPPKVRYSSTPKNEITICLPERVSTATALTNLSDPKLLDVVVRSTGISREVISESLTLSTRPGKSSVTLKSTHQDPATGKRIAQALATAFISKTPGSHLEGAESADKKSKATPDPTAQYFFDLGLSDIPDQPDAQIEALIKACQQATKGSRRATAFKYALKLLIQKASQLSSDQLENIFTEMTVLATSATEQQAVLKALENHHEQWVLSIYEYLISEGVTDHVIDIAERQNRTLRTQMSRK